MVLEATRARMQGQKAGLVPLVLLGCDTLNYWLHLWQTETLGVVPECIAEFVFPSIFKLLGFPFRLHGPVLCGVRPAALILPSVPLLPTGGRPRSLTIAALLLPLALIFVWQRLIGYLLAGWGGMWVRTGSGKPARETATESRGDHGNRLLIGRALWKKISQSEISWQGP